MKKIKLNKQTISVLNYPKLNQIKGGLIRVQTCEMDCCSIGHTIDNCYLD